MPATRSWPFRRRTAGELDDTEWRNQGIHRGTTPGDDSLTDSVREESTDAVDRAVVVQHASEGRDVVGGHVDIRGKLQLVPGIEAGCVQPHLDSLFSPSPSHGSLQPWIAGLLRCCAVSEPEQEGGARDGCVVTSRGGVDRPRPETSNPVDCRPRLCRSPNFGGGGGTSTPGFEKPPGIRQGHNILHSVMMRHAGHTRSHAASNLHVPKMGPVCS